MSEETMERMMQTQTTPVPRVNHVISRVLLVGLLLALSCMAVGGLLGFLDPGALASRAVPMGDLPDALGQGTPTAFMSLGILLLLATPAVPVLILLVVNLARRRWLFAAIAAIVSGVLVLSVILGLSR